jgi:hypothetical protein
MYMCKEQVHPMGRAVLDEPAAHGPVPVGRVCQIKLVINMFLTMFSTVRVSA